MKLVFSTEKYDFLERFCNIGVVFGKTLTFLATNNLLSQRLFKQRIAIFSYVTNNINNNNISLNNIIYQ